jgi:heptaprenyl diphosphate synthase/octaprenyl-diphosphate synthase
LNNISTNDLLQKELKEVEAKLILTSEKRYIEDPELLTELLQHVLETPGKLMRPTITILSSKFNDHDHNLPITMAGAVELLHIATLIHDDTVDNSPIRRGKETVSNKWGDKIAVLLGDYIFAASATMVCETNNIRVIKRFSETIMDLSSGELSEISNSFNWRLTKAEYNQRIYYKTASLFSTSSESGAILSGAPENIIQSLKSYGYHLGMAFQIVDDILDFEGNQDKIGKPVGNDLRQGTITLPSLLLIEKYPNNNPIEKLCANRDIEHNLIEAISSIQNSNIMTEAYKIANDHCSKAKLAVKSLHGSQYKNSLVELADYVMDRDY